jgi:Glycosyltransferase family 10 (fucosyltransferase) C-term
MMSVRVYLHPKVKHTIFQKENTRNVLVRMGIEFVDTPEQASVLIGNYEKLIRDFIDSFGASKRYLLWTHEPNFWTSTEKWATIAGQRVRTMSLHSGEVFFDNYFYASVRPNPAPRPWTARRKLNRTMIMVAGAKMRGDPEVVRRANGIDLSKIRYELALAGHSTGQLHVYGRMWPAGVSRGQSRMGQWSLAKYKILEDYDFNVCFENSLVPNYCSEKIWQAIYCGCLPVYYGQDSIYRDFPRDSFLDYARLDDPHALFDAVNRMSCKEFNKRYEKCRRVFQRAFPLGDVAREQAARYAALQIIALDLGTPAIARPAAAL